MNNYLTCESFNYQNENSNFLNENFQTHAVKNNVKVYDIQLPTKNHKHIIMYVLCLQPLVGNVNITHRTTDCFDDRLLLRRQIRVKFAEKG